jgi:arsenate reductase-like glutaredoxin family protein
MKASKVLDASAVEPKEVVPASRKLGAADARALIGKASQVIVAKGKQVERFKPGKDKEDVIVAAMLGPTGNLRAPTIVSGKTVMVGFNAELYAEYWGAA